MKINIAATIILALLVSSYGFSQENSKKKISLTGKVINREGKAVKGALIFLDGFDSERRTNHKGVFKLKLKPDVKKIAFYSFTQGGYELDFFGQTTVEIIINPEFPMVTIAPSEDGKKIETGYATYYMDELTGSVASIREERFENNTYKTIFEMIASEVPGVTVVGNSIRIRGLSSFNMSNQPLFVVNGVAVSSIDHISPRDVASIDILKGPQTAMYGSRGSTGVIVIKLKGSEK